MLSRWRSFWCYQQYLDNVGQSKILFFPPFSWSSCFLGLLFELFLAPFRCPMSSLLRCPLLVTNIQYVSCDPRFFDCSAFANDLASFSVIAVLKGSSTSRMVTGAYYAYQYNYYVGQSVLLTRFWADFTSALWNFCRWGADSHETSLAFKRDSCIHRLNWALPM